MPKNNYVDIYESTCPNKLCVNNSSDLFLLIYMHYTRKLSSLLSAVKVFHSSIPFLPPSFYSPSFLSLLISVPIYLLISVSPISFLPFTISIVLSSETIV